jgi:electron transfer flavoprotein alpha subunit
VIALIPVRDGVLAPGGPEAAAEAGGRALLIGSGTAAAVASLPADTRSVLLAEAGAFRPSAWAAALAPQVAGDAPVIVPASPDGRDLAPRLAVGLGWPLHAGALRVEPERVTLALPGLRAQARVSLEAAAVVTLYPAARAWLPGPPADPEVVTLDLDVGGSADAEVLEVIEADPASIDLAEARRIVGAGIGLRSYDTFRRLETVAARLGASVGATRPVVDAGWTEFSRQIGTTGAIVDPDLYLAFAVSGAVQHVSGLGNPDHIVTVNLDPSCPMMAMSDLAVVSDAPAVLAELERLLEEEAPDG